MQRDEVWYLCWCDVVDFFDLFWFDFVWFFLVGVL